MGAWKSRGYLRHLDIGSHPQFLTWRLADSLPADVLRQVKREAGEDSAELYRRYERELDRGLGSCLLKNPVAAGIVQNALVFGHGQKYELHSWVVMPNYVHVLLTPFDSTSLAKIVQSIKGFSSHEMNQKLGNRGRQWQPEYFDRAIRDHEHFEKTCRYIEWNPVKAGLAVDPSDFPFSSANPIAFAKLTTVSEASEPVD